MTENRQLPNDYPPEIRLIIPPRFSLVFAAAAMALLPLWQPVGEWLAGYSQRAIAWYAAAGVVALFGMIVYDTRVCAAQRVIVWRRSLLFLIPLRTRRLPMDQIAAVDIDHTSGAACSRPDSDMTRFDLAKGLSTAGLPATAVGCMMPVFSLGHYRIILQTRQRDRYLVFRHFTPGRAIAVAEMLSRQTGARLT
ncbi:MAG: hypothetical protein N2111_11890 [Candidatus Sumerlaeaceae bacterium]|nr:hypothetical protein [Candidatus Sumerlaeaceae bacterium]